MGNPLPYDENMKILVAPYSTVAPVFANNAAPTLAEIDGMSDISEYVTKDGVRFGMSNNRVTGGNIATSHTPENMGTWVAQLSLLIERHTPLSDDDAYTMLSNRGDRFVVLISPFGDPADGGPAYVFPNVQVGTPIPQDPSENTNQRALIEMAVGSPHPVLNAVIAGDS